MNSQMLNIDRISVDVTEVRAMETRIMHLGPKNTHVEVYVFFKRLEDPLTVSVNFGDEEDAAAEWCDIIKGELSHKKELYR
jgi:hypothetical protein